MPTAQEPTAVRGAPWVVASACLGMVTLGIITNAPAVCQTAISAELHYNLAASGLFLGCTFGGLVVGILVAGPLADRVGCRVPLLASAVLEAVGVLAVSVANSPTTACAAMALTGLGLGTYDALGTPLVCAAYPHARGRVSNLLHAFYPFGMFVGILLIIGLQHLGWNWREIYRLLATTVLPFGLVFLFLPLPAAVHQGGSRLSVRTMLRGRAYLLLVAAIFLAGSTELGPSQWLPTYVEKAGGGTQTAGALSLLLLGVAMTVGRLSTSFLHRTIGSRRLLLAGAVASAVAIALASLSWPTPWVPVACIALFGLAVAGLWPTMLAVAGDRFPDAGASMYSVLGAAGNFGGLAAPWLMGVIAEGHGLPLGMRAAAVAPLLLAALCPGLVRAPTEPSAH